MSGPSGNQPSIIRGFPKKSDITVIISDVLERKSLWITKDALLTFTTPELFQDSKYYHERFFQRSYHFESYKTFRNCGQELGMKTKIYISYCITVSQLHSLIILWMSVWPEVMYSLSFLKLVISIFSFFSWSVCLEVYLFACLHLSRNLLWFHWSDLFWYIFVLFSIALFSGHIFRISLLLLDLTLVFYFYNNGFEAFLPF